MGIIEQVQIAVQEGETRRVEALLGEALSEGFSAAEINERGLLGGLAIVGERFADGRSFIPEVLIAARAVKCGLEHLRPFLVQEDLRAAGTVILGTVEGDLHDIGKNIVGMMMASRGLQVIDLGVDVTAETFLAAAVEAEAPIVACSALLTSTLGAMEQVVVRAEKSGIRGSLTIMVGGAAVTDGYQKEIGADLYAADAASAATLALAACGPHASVGAP